MKRAAILIFIAIILTGCYTKNIQLTEQPCQEERAKATFVLWGLVSLNDVRLTDCPAIQVKHSFGDVVVTFLTGGIFSMESVRCKCD